MAHNKAFKTAAQSARSSDAQPLARLVARLTQRYMQKK